MAGRSWVAMEGLQERATSHQRCPLSGILHPYTCLRSRCAPSLRWSLGSLALDDNGWLVRGLVSLLRLSLALIGLVPSGLSTA